MRSMGTVKQLSKRGPSIIIAKTLFDSLGFSWNPQK